MFELFFREGIIVIFHASFNWFLNKMYLENIRTHSTELILLKIGNAIVSLLIAWVFKFTKSVS